MEAEAQAVQILESDGSYAAFAARLRGTGHLSDAWFDGAPRFRAEPVVLSATTARALQAAAEAIAAAHDEVARLVEREPELLDSFFAMTPWQKLMWLAEAPRWHGFARADVFLTGDGPRVCELNSDTPSGQAEAVLLGRLAAAERPGPVDPNRALEERTCALIRAVAPPDAGSALRVGILYPTELPEDLSMIALYRSWFESRGWRVALGSPFNLGRANDGRATLLGEPCDVIVRHYKTDWWGERLPAWDDAPAFADPVPLSSQLQTLLEAVLAGRTAVVNPFGSVLTQNKRSMALLWEQIDRFPPDVRDGVRAVLPRTWRLDAMDPARLRADKDRFVLKSDYGCESDEVILGAECEADVWAASLEHAISTRWIVQERFRPLAAADGTIVNHGVYLVAGKAAGFYARVHAAPDGAGALSAAVLVQESRS